MNFWKHKHSDYSMHYVTGLKKMADNEKSRGLVLMEFMSLVGSLTKQSTRPLDF